MKLGNKKVSKYQISKYQIGKFRARQKATEWQFACSEKCFYASEYAEMASYFEKLGKKYGLLKEFRENGIC